MGEKYLFVKGVKISLEEELKIESGTFNPCISIVLEKAYKAYLDNLGVKLVEKHSLVNRFFL